ncbi:MAG: twin-arginine translocase subunit TatC [Solirubrobacterales bacterium]
MKVKPVKHEDRLTLVEHLDELRTRLIVALVTFAAALGLCLWQNHRILDLLNRPLPDGRTPITFGVTEPFMTTLTVAAYAALALALPVILYQLYAFILPALRPGERRTALPLLLMVPFLFIGGVLFCYFVVLDPAVKFLLDFNSGQFNIQVRARDYYGFVSLLMLSMGLLFQVPIAILTAVRLGLATPQKLREWRRYAILAIAILAALLPTVDPVSMIIEMVPLLVLYELSIVLASMFGGQGTKRAASQPSPEGSG